MTCISDFRAISLAQSPSILRMWGRAIHGLRGPEHYRLDRFWCLNLFQGEGELSIGGKIYPFRSGYAGITWPGVDLVYTFKSKTIKTCAHFIPKRGGSPVNIPIMQDLGGDFDRTRANLQSVTSLYRAHPERAVARLWDILWQLVPMQDQHSANTTYNSPLVAKAMDAIDIHIAEPIEIKALAQDMNISQTHLNRLFKSSINMTVGEYIRSHRLEWAKHLLMHTTLPIKAIAYQVGIPDSQQFNKSMRRQFGCPPSAYR